MPEPTIMRCVGLSRDQRTNCWSVTCPACGHVFSPPTTRLSTQDFHCPKAKCNTLLFARYNDEPPTCSVVEEQP